MVSPDYINPKEPETYDFSTALDDLKEWKQISRLWWNWKWMYLELQTPDKHSKMTLPYIYMVIPSFKTSEDGSRNEIDFLTRVPWVAS